MYNQKGKLADLVHGVTWVEMQKWVHQVANQMKFKLPSNVELDDLIQNGHIGLLDAIDKYNALEEGGASFKTYAFNRIRGAILDALRSDDPGRREVRKQQRRIEEALRHWEHEHPGQHPQGKDIAQVLGCSVDEYYKVLTESFSTQQLYLEDIIGEEDNDRMFPDDAPGPAQQLEWKEKIQGIVHAIESLSEREQQIMSMLYELDMTMKEIGEVFGISEGRVSQIHSQAIARIQKYNNIEKPKKN